MQDSVIRKDEKYIKELLRVNFEGVGNFQQFEFTSSRMNCRPDFVLLENDKFTYFEIKSELDTFFRLNSQFNGAMGLFTEMYLIIPKKKLDELVSFGLVGRYGVYLVEDLEAGKKDAYMRPDNHFTVDIASVADILWKDELLYYVQQYNPDITCTDRWKGKRLTLKTMSQYELHSFFTLFYSNKDALRILNEVLPGRRYGYRDARASYGQQKIV